MAVEPKPQPCAWCHWPVRLVPAQPGSVPTEAAHAEQAEPDRTTTDPLTAPDDDAPPRVRRCTNPWCPSNRAGTGVLP